MVFNDLSVLVRCAPWTDADAALRPAINMPTRDGGLSWTTFLPNDVPAAAQGYLLGHDSTGWILSNSTHGCRASNDFGRTWNIPVATPAGGCAVYRDGMLIASRWLSFDRGASWRAFTPPAEFALFGYENVRRIGTDTLVRGRWISRDLGVTWVAMLPAAIQPPMAGSLAFTAISASRLVRVSDASAVQLSTDGGRTWADATVDTPLAFGGPRKLRFVSPQVGRLSRGNRDFAPDEVPLYRSRDGGATWAALGATGRTFFLDETTGFAIVGGALKVSADNGTTWSTPAVPGAAPVSDARACKPSQFAAGDGGSAPRMLALLFFDASNGALFDTVGNIWVTRDGGVTCTKSAPNLGDNKAASVARTGSHGVWLVGEEGSVKRSDDPGDTWQAVDVGVGVGIPFDARRTAVYFADAQNGWLAGNFGRAAFTRDGGRTWSAQRTGLWGAVQQLQFIDPRTGWMLGEDGVIVGTGTGGN